MSERQQFTFYRSFWEAIKLLPPREQQAILPAICAYALDDIEPDLSGTTNAFFCIMRPILDASKRKAEAGRLGGSAKANDKQSGSKTEANGKQNASKPEASLEEANGKQDESNDEAEGKQNASKYKNKNKCYSFSSQAPKSESEKKAFDHDSKAYQCAVFLDACICERLPTKPAAAESVLQKWADAFDKLHRIEQQDWDTIAAALEWSQTDSFWQQNILSGDKFRKQFFTLLAKMPKE